MLKALLNGLMVIILGVVIVVILQAYVWGASEEALAIIYFAGVIWASVIYIVSNKKEKDEE